ncbi:protein DETOXIFICATION 46, chloroplastic isoform X1 [Amborella trichopoda]|uniref:protein DETOXIFICATION 46, chloroplastic isoform X1 n=1 Tax=Amborella trichopoda TaxID=13333 RepID=UPI0009BD3B46|nr:protein DETOXIFICATION 46, chloroplastic isoform X1 [Amborella trichopoda]|eukprot:XP_020517237.1 protein DETOXIFICATION 46, chloroplastic isoform X1 [Amborella trichopoda]
MLAAPAFLYLSPASPPLRILRGHSLLSHRPFRLSSHPFSLIKPVPTITYLSPSFSSKFRGRGPALSSSFSGSYDEIKPFDNGEFGSNLPFDNGEMDLNNYSDNGEIGSDKAGDEILGLGNGGSQSIWKQMKDIVMFAGPATGLWVCGPLMSLIDTAVIGQSSSLELAALGPATVVCDYLGYVFMFLSIATSNLVATAIATKDRKEAQQHISMLLFVAFTCGMGMLLFTKFFGTQLLTAFTGSKNIHMVPAANTYVQIRGLAWPAVLVGLVAQSVSLALKDSWGPLKVLAIASLVNGIGDVVLCSLLGYGIAGAAWATMVSQIVAGFMMIDSLNKMGFDAYSMSFPSSTELLLIFKLAAPVFVTMTSKVAFYSLLTYFATSMGTVTIAAHQVMVGVYCMCTVWGEPLSQTAQSFMPELICGVHRNLAQARTLLKSLIIIGSLSGLILGSIGTLFPWLCPYIFTNDHDVIREMHKVLLPYFVALMVTPPTHSLEGTLMAGRDLRFLSLSMTGCFFGCGILLWVCI